MKEILEKLKATKKLAESDVAGDIRTRPGREMMKRQAQIAVGDIQREATQAFRKVGFTVFVEGPGSEEFAKQAKEVTESIYVDFVLATKTVRDAIAACLAGRNKEFSPEAFTVLIREVRQLGADLGMDSIPNISYDGIEQAGTEEQINGIVNRYLFKYTGPDFMAAVVEKAALEKVLMLNGSNPVVPVLVSGLSPDMYRDLSKYLFRGSFVVATTPNKNVVLDDVLKVFNEIRESFPSSFLTDSKPIVQQEEVSVVPAPVVDAAVSQTTAALTSNKKNKNK